MASINGVSIKNLKKFTGDEGITYQGNVYIDGKKVGFWSQDGNGGCDDFYFDTTELVKRAKEYYTKHPKVDDYQFYDKEIKDIDFTNPPLKDANEIDEEIFMYDLLCLALDEKDYKKGVKNGYSVFGVISYYSVNGPIPWDKTISANSMEVLENAIKEEQKKYPYAYLKAYASLDDFIK